MAAFAGAPTLEHEALDDSTNVIFKEAFVEAKKAIGASKCSEKSRRFIDSFNSLEDVQAAVETTFQKYQDHTKSTAKSWLYKLSQRIHYYGQVLDVMVQHHPEYVSLAWGMMKFLFIISIEHENTTTGIAKALAEIGDLLPQMQLTTQLYSSPRLRMALSKLYANIIQFLIRAQSWCEGSRLSSLKRIAQSVVSPFELRYNDILESIQYHSNVIKELGVSGNQVDVRSIRGTTEETNRKVDQLSAELASIKQMIGLNSTALINTNNRLTDLQFSQIMASISHDLGSVIWDPSKTIRYLTSLRRSQNLDGLPGTFYSSLKLRQWTTSPTSELCLIMGNVPSRFALRYFCLDIIHQLRAADVPFLLALKINHLQDVAPDSVSNIDLLKYLVKQALEYTKGLQTEGSMALNCTTVSCARSEAEWLDILGFVLESIGKQVYIILDLGILDRQLQSAHFDFSWLKAFCELFTKLSTQRPNLRVKVMLVNYNSSVPFGISAVEYSKFCIPVRAEVTTIRLQKKNCYERPGRFSITKRRW